MSTELIILCIFLGIWLLSTIYYYLTTTPEQRAQDSSLFDYIMRYDRMTPEQKAEHHRRLREKVAAMQDQSESDENNAEK